MNLTNNPNKEQLKRLFASCDDTAGHHILYVTPDGEVVIVQLPQNLGPAGWASVNKDNIKFRLETWIRGNGYTGSKAAENPTWINRIFECITNHWEKGTKGYIDVF